jgi:chromate reductase
MPPRVLCPVLALSGSSSRASRPRTASARRSVDIACDPSLNQSGAFMPDKHSLSLVSLCGSLRKGSFNAAIQRTLPELAPEGVTIRSLSGIADMPLYNADIQAEGFPRSVTEMADSIRQADGLIVCSPEYNYSIPGVLKNAIDWMSRLKQQPFAGKPVLIQSASGGILGGARMQYHLRQTLVFVEALAFNLPEVMVGTAQSKFDTDLKLIDQATRDLIKQQLAAFAEFVRKVVAA